LAHPCKPQCQLRQAHVSAVLLDQLGEPQPAVAVAAFASDFKVVELADEVAPASGTQRLNWRPA
jgi:hypothetical protein